MFDTLKLNILFPVLNMPCICYWVKHNKVLIFYDSEKHLAGAEHGQFVSFANGKNVVYNSNIDVSKLSKADKIKWQNAMRARWQRNNLKSDKMNAQR